MQPISLFLESAYSFSGSNIDIETLVKDAQLKGYKALALTDKKMHGAFRFYHACHKANIKPIIGLQVKLEGLLKLAHINVVCYAKNSQGYRNLLKISSLQSYHEYLPLALFKKYSKDLTTIVYPYLSHWNAMSSHDENVVLHELKLVTETLILAVHPSLKVIDNREYSTIDVDMVYYAKPEDKGVYNTLRKIFQQQEIDIDHGYIKELSEFRFNEQALQKTESFINQHDYEIEKTPTMLPTFPNQHNLKSSNYLRILSEKGLIKRLGSKNKGKKDYFIRLEKELDAIIDLGYADYFLIVWDVVRYAKKADILVGPGRGSAPGSLVAYALGITDIDPLQHGLMFERFLNKDRINMPDIDIDFPDYARERVIRYTEEKYGKEFVSLICTFGTFLKKSALRDSARVYSIESKYVNEISRRIEEYDSIHEMIERDANVKNRIQQSDAIAFWLMVAAKIEGLPRHVSTHAAGIVLSQQPIIDYTAIQPGLLDMHQTQFSQEDLESLGLLKIDFLGLRNLTMIEDVLKYIETHHRKKLNMYTLPLDDKATFEMLRTKTTTGLFQLESPGMRRLIKDMKITHFNDIVTVLALYRPGPMESISVYLKRRHGESKIDYLTEALEPILKDTQGILLYQEQIMEIAYKIAGYTMNEADILRRAVSKKDERVLSQERENFVSKALLNGSTEKTANAIYDYIVKFANYGFNKSHSVAYAMIAYWMAYLKTHFPEFFIAVLMQNALGNESLMKAYIEEAFTYKLNLHKPDIQFSGLKFKLVNDRLYFPLLGIKNIGKTLCYEIEEERRKGKFSSYIDFIHRTQGFLNTRVYQYLIYAGALDCFNLSRKTMIENIDAVIRFKEYATTLGSDEFVVSQFAEFNEEVRLRYERDALGFNWFEDPLSDYYRWIKKHQFKTVKYLEEAPLKKAIEVVGYIQDVKKISTKKGDQMAFLTLGDNVAKIDAIAFPSVFNDYKEWFITTEVYRFKGTLELRQSKRQFVINSLETLKK